MGVPPLVSDYALLREHAYFDSGNKDFVMPPHAQNNFEFIRVQDKGLGLFNYKFAHSSNISSYSSYTFKTYQFLFIAFSLILLSFLVYVFTLRKVLLEKFFPIRKSNWTSTLVNSTTPNTFISSHPYSSPNTPKLDAVGSMPATPEGISASRNGFNLVLADELFPSGKEWPLDIDKIHVMV